jgi:hypothetical protein
MKEEKIEEIRGRLKSFVNYEEGKALRKELKKYADENYKPKYSSNEHLKFLNNFSCYFKESHPQSSNYPYYMTMFSVPTQMIMGDNVYQLLDKAIDIFKENNGVPEIKIFTYNKNGNK